MKSRILFIVSLVALLIIESCGKKVDLITCPCNYVYSKWSVNTINLQSYVFPQGKVWDTTYNASATDYIDLSTKGEIVFNINQVQHIDTYDTSKYDLLKDTSVVVDNSIKSGFSYVSISNIKPNSITLEERTFGIDTESKTIYNLEK